ncbi:MAG TPA: AraC family transcriptional regulator [Epulopiscium sp.]|nr:AraC family transcriptional regulator [Candidatus Epulonipiscium sp.]
MIKLLIVDDEPLMQIGIKSMLDWKSLNIEIYGTAMNGADALELIEEELPDIVLCDIKMPIMTGLELIKICRDRYEKLPLFIFLTSYEEFSLVQEALKHQAFDYLIKLDITPETLTNAIKKALKVIYDHKNQGSSSSTSHLQYFYEKFMIRLLNNLFVDKEQFEIQAKELKLDFIADTYITTLCTIVDAENTTLEQEKLLNLYLSTTQMIENLVKKHMPCFVATLDPKHFCIIFKLNGNDYEAQKEIIRKALTTSFDMVYNYFNIHVYAKIGSPYDNPLKISNSYQEARQIGPSNSPERPVLFYSDWHDHKKGSQHTTFNLGIFKNDIRLAFESFDSESLEQILDTLIDLFTTHPNMYLQAMDAACNILYLTLSLLPVSKDVLDDIYKNETDGYRSIYKKTQTIQIVGWLEEFKQGICHLLNTQQKNYKNHIIKDIEDYIHTHIRDKLSLNGIASLFGISPNYLSTLFKKTTGIGFNEYITSQKITLAKAALLETDKKIYEVAEELGFESAFYFSKVFKKTVGLSPRDFIQKNS